MTDTSVLWHPFVVVPAIFLFGYLFRVPLYWIWRRIDLGIALSCCRIGMHEYQDGHPQFEPDQVVCWRCGKEQGAHHG